MKTSVYALNFAGLHLEHPIILSTDCFVFYFFGVFFCCIYDLVTGGDSLP